MIIAAIALTARDAHPLAAARALAQRLDEPVLLVHVLTPTPSNVDADTDANRRAAVVERLLKVAGDLEKDGINVQPEVLDGDDVVSAIHACASRLRPTLVVIGGRDGEPYQGTDHIADRLSRCLPCPFLVSGKAGALIEANETRRLRALVALDGTAASGAAIAQLRELRDLIPIDCNVVSFYWPPDEQKRRHLRRSFTLVADPVVEGLIVGELRARVGELPGEGDVTIEASPMLGTLGLHIAAEAERHHVDFILVGSHQRSPLGGLVHGSVTQQLLRDSPYPVMFAPLAAREPKSRVSEPKHILVATDLSDFGNRAVAYAYAYFRNDGGSVEILHVLTSASEARLRAMTDRAVRGLSRGGELASSMLQGLVPSSAETYGIATSVHIESGEDVAYHIAQRAKAINADVICLAAHGPGQVRGALAGSLVLDVVHRAESPVLLVR